MEEEQTSSEVEINLNPYQGLKHKSGVARDNVRDSVEINLNPYQGLKLQKLQEK